MVRHGFPGKPHLTEVEWADLRQGTAADVTVGSHVFSAQIGSGYYTHDDGTVRGCGWMPAVGSVYEITDIDDGTIIGRRVTDGHEVIQAPPTPDAPLLILTAAP